MEGHHRCLREARPAQQAGRTPPLSHRHGVRKGEILQLANRIRQLAGTLKSMSMSIDDKDMAMAFLNGLPDRFDSLISALDRLGDSDKSFTLEFVKSRV